MKELVVLIDSPIPHSQDINFISAATSRLFGSNIVRLLGGERRNLHISSHFTCLFGSNIVCLLGGERLPATPRCSHQCHRHTASLTLCSTHSVQPTPLQFSSHCGARGTAMPTDQNQLVSLPSAPGRPNHLDFPLAHSCPIFSCYLGMEI